MKNSSAQTIFASVRRGFSSIADSSVSPRAKHVWKEQDKFVLGLAFVGGWFGKAAINTYKRREHCLRVGKSIEDEEKRIRIRGEIRNKGKKKDD